jgi:hypothetical protein
VAPKVEAKKEAPKVEAKKEAPKVPPTLTERPNCRFSDLGFALPDPRNPRVCKGEMAPKTGRFGLSVRVGG